MNIDNIFRIDTESDFNEVALNVFRYQAINNPIYKDYLSLIGVNISDVKGINDIPFLPIELYKESKIYCGEEPHDLVFLSSGTTGMEQSKHYVRSADIYERAFIDGFTKFIGSPSDCNIYALLPGYLEREGSSLIYMIQKLIEQSNDGGFFLYNHDDLINKLQQRDKTKKTLLFGVTFALLDLAEEGELKLDEDVIIMETGGMKGRREEMSKEELHEKLKRSFGVEYIASEYGMCEMLSQAYALKDGVFYPSDTMRVVIRDIHDPFARVDNGKRGGVNVIDLANIYSCSFIQTQDMGIKYDNGTFRIEGRIVNADIRGCSLLIAD